ncbi:MAG: DUF998 domain-containing protein [Promethearchaeati archaeon SRVP18_Atabeyarchaeia-1]
MATILKRLTEPNTAAFCGVVGPFYAFMSIMIAILVSSGGSSPSSNWFTWTGNALSDLGHPVLHPTSALIFNSGLIVGGVITFFSILGLGRSVRKSIGALVGTGILLVAAVALICVGLFNETFSPWHFLFSVMLFASMALALLVLGGAMVANRATRWFGVATLLLGVVAASPWLLMSWAHAAIPETISAITVYIWVLMMATRLGTGKEAIPK